jgi:hypothetical protein
MKRLLLIAATLAALPAPAYASISLGCGPGKILIGARPTSPSPPYTSSEPP